jgi:UrcA family protein
MGKSGARCRVQYKCWTQHDRSTIGLKNFLTDDKNNKTHNRAWWCRIRLDPPAEGTTMQMSKRTALQVLPVAVAMMADSCIDPGNAAYAAVGGEPPSVRVSVKDLNLTTHAGVAALYQRIRNAARSVCGPVDIALPEEKAAWDRCVDETIGSAVAKLGSAKLAEYYLAKTHRPHSITTAEISKAAARAR